MPSPPAPPSISNLNMDFTNSGEGSSSLSLDSGSIDAMNDIESSLDGFEGEHGFSQGGDAMMTMLQDVSGNTGGRKQKGRVTAFQVTMLDNLFKQTPNPDSAQRRALAEQCGMSERSVQIWFQNRRARTRLAQRKGLPPPTLRRPKGVNDYIGSPMSSASPMSASMRSPMPFPHSARTPLTSTPVSASMMVTQSMSPLSLEFNRSVSLGTSSPYTATPLYASTPPTSATFSPAMSAPITPRTMSQTITFGMGGPSTPRTLSALSAMPPIYEAEPPAAVFPSATLTPAPIFGPPPPAPMYPLITGQMAPIRTQPLTSTPITTPQSQQSSRRRLSADHLTWGTWRRTLTPGHDDFIFTVDLVTRTIEITIESSGHLFRIDIPFDTVLRIDIASPSGNPTASINTPQQQSVTPAPSPSTTPAQSMPPTPAGQNRHSFSGAGMMPSPPSHNLTPMSSPTSLTHASRKLSLNTMPSPTPSIHSHTHGHSRKPSLTFNPGSSPVIHSRKPSLTLSHELLNLNPSMTTFPSPQQQSTVVTIDIISPPMFYMDMNMQVRQEFPAWVQVTDFTENSQASSVGRFSVSCVSGSLEKEMAGVLGWDVALMAAYSNSLQQQPQ
ncbi:hypothetical protein HDU76_006188 [Blyttiomyces sp. JEL0837]|nr:hypothetical protein HDU76_006188 [Blyttiomyces sp. JEL0837]